MIVNNCRTAINVKIADLIDNLNLIGLPEKADGFYINKRLSDRLNKYLTALNKLRSV